MNTVKDALAQKSGALIHIRSGDMVVEALRQMRDNRVRSVLVIDDDVLVGIVTQGDCAIKVLLPGLDAKQTPVGQVMTGNPVTVKPDDRLLDPKGKAIVNINKGEAFYGEVDILGKPYVTGYDPIKDASGKVIGIWYVGYEK